MGHLISTIYSDLKVRNSGLLEPGDLILVKNVGICGNHKLADHWERPPNVFVSQPVPDIPAFCVKQEHSGSRKIMTLHRNTLSFMSPVRHSTHAGSVNNSDRTVAHVVDGK